MLSLLQQQPQGIVSDGSQQRKSAFGLEGLGSAASHWPSNVTDETWGVEL